MNTSRWTPASSSFPATSPAQQPARCRRATARERALARCARGQHSTMPTFRPGETVCPTCGLVTYCPTCLTDAQLLPPLVHAIVQRCSMHLTPPVRPVDPHKEDHL